MSKMTERLNRIGIINGWDFAKRGGAITWVTFNTHHPHAIGYTDHRAEIYHVRDGQIYKRREPIRERGKNHHEHRRLSVAAAQKLASERYGVSDWVATPFRDTWVPRYAYDKVMADLKQAEAENADH